MVIHSNVQIWFPLLKALGWWIGEIKKKKERENGPPDYSAEIYTTAELALLYCKTAKSLQCMTE